MKILSQFILRIVVKSLIVAGTLFIIIYVFDTIRDEIYYAKIMKEAATDTARPIVRGYKENYDVTKDTTYIRKLEDETRKLLK